MPKDTINIFVVDDEASELVSVRHALEAAGGFTVREANSYEQALTRFGLEGKGFDLLITDVTLPEKSGIELAKTLQNKKPSLKILFTSGWVGSEVLRDSGVPLVSGVFLQKPFRASDLVAAVNRVLSSPQIFRWPESGSESMARGEE